VLAEALASALGREPRPHPRFPSPCAGTAGSTCEPRFPFRVKAKAQVAGGATLPASVLDEDLERCRGPRKGLPDLAVYKIRIPTACQASAPARATASHAWVGTSESESRTEFGTCPELDEIGVSKTCRFAGRKGTATGIRTPVSGLRIRSGRSFEFHLCPVSAFECSSVQLSSVESGTYFGTWFWPDPDRALCSRPG
jgi:hypothetical protein